MTRCLLRMQLLSINDMLGKSAKGVEGRNTYEHAGAGIYGVVLIYVASRFPNVCRGMRVCGRIVADEE